MVMHILSRALLAGLLIVGVVAPAAAQAPGISKDLSKISSGDYVLETTHANVIFKINHMGLSNYYGRFNKMEGKLHFDAHNPEKSALEVSVEPASVDTNNQKLQGELQGEKFFNTSKFPTATFTSTSITRHGDTGTVTGNLTMLGVSKPMELKVTFNGGGKHPFNNKDALGFNATATIKRSEWGLNALVPMVSDNVELEIEAEFIKADAAAAAEDLKKK